LKSELLQLHRVEIQMITFISFYFYRSCFVTFQNVSGLAAYVASQIDSSLSWKVDFAKFNDFNEPSEINGISHA